MIIAVDCDLCVVDVIPRWVSYLNERSGKDVTLPEKSPYEVYKLFGELSFDPMDFWKDERLYDGEEPIAGSVEVLSGLAEKGHEIIFVSYCTGNHGHSKYDFLKQHFPFMKGAFWTREKGYIRCDVAIDDRMEYLSLYDGKLTEKILLNTKYEQTKPIEDDVVVCDNWGEIGGYLWEF